MAGAVACLPLPPTLLTPLYPSCPPGSPTGKVAVRHSGPRPCWRGCSASSSHDLGQEGAAQAYYLAGFQLAAEADPHGHAAWMTRDLAASALARAAGRADGATKALLDVTHARILAALLGERPAAARALLAAEDSLSRDSRPQADCSLLAAGVGHVRLLHGKSADRDG